MFSYLLYTPSVREEDYFSLSVEACVACLFCTCCFGPKLITPELGSILRMRKSKGGMVCVVGRGGGVLSRMYVGNQSHPSVSEGRGNITFRLEYETEYRDSTCFLKHRS